MQGVGVAAAGTMAFGGYVLAEPWTTGVTHYKISPPRWPAGLSLRLAILADLHVCEPWMGIERVRSIVEHANSLEPDCVLLLGDYVSGLKMRRLSEHVPHKVWANALGKLRARHGVYSVLGNHDWWEDPAEVQRGDSLPRAGLALQDAGIAVFEGVPELNARFPQFPAEEDGFTASQAIEVHEAQVEILQPAADFLQLLERGLELLHELQLPLGQLVDLRFERLDGMAVAGGELADDFFQLMIGPQNGALEPLQLFHERRDLGQQRVGLSDGQGLRRLGGHQPEGELGDGASS